MHQEPRHFSRFIFPLGARGVEIKPTFLNLVLAPLVFKKIS